MSAIVAFIVVHVTLALLVPRSLLAMITGGPPLDAAPAAASPVIAEVEPVAESTPAPQIETVAEPSHSSAIVSC
jgi:hypothetical protein